MPPCRSECQSGQKPAHLPLAAAAAGRRETCSTPDWLKSQKTRGSAPTRPGRSCVYDLRSSTLKGLAVSHARADFLRLAQGTNSRERARRDANSSKRSLGACCSPLDIVCPESAIDAH